MERRALLLAPFTLLGQYGSRQREFARYPFDKWKQEGERTSIRWSVEVTPPHLSAHQRLLATIRILVPAREIAKRGGRGELVILLELLDRDQQPWRTNFTLNLAYLPAVPEGARRRDVQFTQDVFVVPGDYELSLAMTGDGGVDHNFTRRRLRVSDLRGDPLQGAWESLPAVEFLRPLGIPDVWYQPYLRGKLHLPVATRQPVHLDILVNMTASARISGSLNAFRHNMSLLVPVLKVLAGSAVEQGSMDVTLLDLTAQRTWRQDNIRGLNWSRLREPLLNNQPGVVDVQSLAARTEMRRFFRDEVLQRVMADIPEPLRAVIVLSAPVFLEHQQKTEPVTLERDPSRRVFYLQYRPLGRMRMRPEAESGATMPLAGALPDDDIERLLKPFDARVYEAYSPETARKGLAGILGAISRM